MMNEEISVKLRHNSLNKQLLHKIEVVTERYEVMSLVAASVYLGSVQHLISSEANAMNLYEISSQARKNKETIKGVRGDPRTTSEFMRSNSNLSLVYMRKISLPSMK